VKSVVFDDTAPTERLPKAMPMDELGCARAATGVLGCAVETLPLSGEHFCDPRKSSSMDVETQETPEGTGGSKVLLLIRHGESMGNEKCRGLVRCLTALRRCRCPPAGDATTSCQACASIACCQCSPTFRDPPLSLRGEAQVAEIGDNFAADAVASSLDLELVVHSDLQRTRKTCQSLFGGEVPIVESSLFREWYWTEVFGSCTSKGSWNTRVKACKEWLATRPERVIAVVGHGMLFQAMQEATPYFKNVEVRKCLMDVATRNISAGEILYSPKV